MEDDEEEEEVKKIEVKVDTGFKFDFETKPAAKAKSVASSASAKGSAFKVDQVFDVRIRVKRTLYVRQGWASLFVYVSCVSLWLYVICGYILCQRVHVLGMSYVYHTPNVSRVWIMYHARDFLRVLYSSQNIRQIQSFRGPKDSVFHKL